MKLRLLLVLLLAAPAFADEETKTPPTPEETFHDVAREDISNEFTGGSMAALGLGLSGSPASTFSATVGYAVSLDRNFQLAVTSSLLTASVATAFTATIGPVINFGGVDLRDDVFLGVGVGVTFASALTFSNTYFTFGATIGKRFKVLDNVSYRPSLSFNYPLNSVASLTITPVAFSVLF